MSFYAPTFETPQSALEVLAGGAGLVFVLIFLAAAGTMISDAIRRIK